MQNNLNFWDIFLHASIIVQLIIVLLMGLSVISWMVIIQRHYLLIKARNDNKAFDTKFWSGEDLYRLYDASFDRKDSIQGCEKIFFNGFKEYVRLSQMHSSSPESILQGSIRAMRLAMNREVDSLEHSVPFLGTVASVTPYIGLFGTIWGIMSSFMALDGKEQATLQMVAPGIAEALIATAMGLFAAIPAVIAYNRLSLQVMELEQTYENFIGELTQFLHRYLYARKSNTSE